MTGACLYLRLLHYLTKVWIGNSGKFLLPAFYFITNNNIKL